MLRFTPRSYQLADIKFLVSRPAGGLFWDMGLGKTVAMLEVFRHLRAARAVSRLLVVAPLRVVHHVWPAEVKQWTNSCGFSVAIAHGSAEARTQAFASKADVTLINYDNLKWLAETKCFLPDMLVLDESTRVKHTRTGRFRALRALLPRFKRRYILTGTPAPNGLEDLYGQIYALDGGASLGRTLTAFRQRYFTPDIWGHTWDLKPGAEELIYKQIEHLVRRRSAIEHLEDLPSVVRQPVWVALPGPARRIYDELEREFLVELKNGTITAANAAVKSGKLRQVTNGFLYHEDGKAERVHEAKIEALEEVFESLNGEPTLVAYCFREDAEMLEAEFDVPSLSACTPKRAKELLVQWNAGKLPALALHPASAGHGLNLQHGGHHVIFYGLDWNLELFDQVIGRLHRSGQKSTVLSHEILAENTIDVGIRELLASKDRTQQALLNALNEKSTRHN